MPFATFSPTLSNGGKSPTKFALRGRRKVSVLLCASIVLLILSSPGCSGPGSDQPGPTTQAPAITSANNTTLTEGVAGSFTVIATGSPTPSIAESGALPAGVTFNAGNLSGTPTVNGTFNLTFTASNGVSPNAAQNFALTVTAPASTITSVTVSCPSSVTIGATVSCTATVTGTGNYSPSVTWASSNTGIATIDSSGIVTGVASGTATFTATSTQDTSKSGTSAPVNIAAGFSNASLSGNYIVELNSSTAGYAFAEELTADGNGNITGEEIPCQMYAGTQSKATYYVDNHGGGQILINGTPCLYFSLDGNGSGYVVEFTESPVAGTLVKQTGTIGPGLSAFSGNWVFEFQGTDSAGNPAAAAGMLSLSPSGSIVGSEDFADGIGSGNNLSKVPFSGTATYSGGLSGTGTIAISSSQGTSSFAYYPVSNTNMAIVSTDTANLAGWAEMQQGTFSTSSLTGSYVFLLSGSSPVSGDGWNPDNPGYAHEVGEIVLDGKGNITGIFDLNESSFVIAAESLSGSYNMTSNGQGQAAVQDAYAPDTFDLYMISPNKAYVIDTGGENVMVGYLLMQQGGPFSTSSFAGQYAYLDLGATGTAGWYVGVGQMTASSGVITSWAEYNTRGLSQSGTITQSIQTNGRGVVNLGTEVGNFAFYLISPSQAAIVGIDPDEAQVGVLSGQF